MNMIFKNQFTKSLVSITLSLSLFFSGSMLLSAKPAQAASTSVSSSTSANRIISTGKKYIGAAYDFGAQSGKTNAFDCSSFTQFVFKKAGISLPRSSKQQSKVGSYVRRSQLKPGDLVFFYKPVHHVAIYIGNGKILHTYGKPGVIISNLNSGWWKNNYATARRVV
ncbi:MAG: C40 family peptidase [Paenibacillaceae bacterium]